MPVRSPRADKVQAVEDIQEALGRANGFLLTNYRGLNVAEITTLRGKLREAGAEYHVVKNTLFVRALGEIPDDLRGLLVGPTAVAICMDDSVAPSKALFTFLRDLRKPDVTVKGGYVDGRVLSADDVVALSKLPPKHVILGQVVGTIQAPLTNFAGTLHGVLSEFARTLQALADQRQGQAA